MRFNKTSPFLMERTLFWVVLLTGFTILAVPGAGAVEVELTYANDFLVNNELDDDLYTFALKMAMRFGPYDVTLSENAFTDKTNEIRFDETYLTVGRPLPPWLGRWRSYAEAGFVHVGEGLLGEDIQNGVHQLIGTKEVELPYIESSRAYPVVGLALERDLPPVGPFITAAEVELRSAVGFKSHATAAMRATWQISSPLLIETRLGARYSETSFEALEPWVKSVGPLWEMEVELYDRLVLMWNYNEYGTRMQHFHLGYRVKATGKKRLSRDVDP